MVIILHSVLQHLRETNGTPFSAGLFPTGVEMRKEVEVLDQGKVWKGVIIYVGQQNGQSCFSVECASGGRNYGVEV